MRIIVPLGAMMVGFVFWTSCTTHPSGNDEGTLLAEGSLPANQYSFGDEFQISGSLICAHCYALNSDNTGIHHELPKSGYVENCASKCATLGYPIAVLSINTQKDSSIWVLRTSSSLFADYMTHEAKVLGTYVADGLVEPTSIKVKTMTEWVDLY